MKTACPHCGSRFEVDDAYLNQQTDCPSCGKYFLISAEKPSSYVNEQTPFKQKHSITPKIRGIETKNESYKKPILSWVFHYSALLCLGVAGVMVLLGIVYCKDFSLRIEHIIAFASMIACAVIDFGIAQIINCLAKTAYNTDQIVKLLKDGKAG